MLLRLGRVVGPLGRHEHVEAIGRKARPQQPGQVGEPASGGLQAPPIQDVEPVVPRLLVVDPRREAAPGEAIDVGVLRAPHPVDADEQRPRLRHGAQEQQGQLVLLPRPPVVERNVGEAPAEGLLEPCRVEQLGARGADHDRVECARAHHGRQLIAVVAVHDDVRAERVHRQIAERVHQRDEAEGCAQHQPDRHEKPLQEARPAHISCFAIGAGFKPWARR